LHNCRFAPGAKEGQVEEGIAAMGRFSRTLAPILALGALSLSSQCARATSPTPKGSFTVAKLPTLPATPPGAPKPVVLDTAPDMLYAFGEGAMPTVKEQPNRAKAYLQAKAYAKMQAIASLAQAAKGTMICYRSTGQGYVADTQIKEEIKGMLECVQVVSVKKRLEGKDYIVEVGVRAPKPVPLKEPPAKPVQVAPSPPKPALPSWASGSGGSSASGYTSVVIDAKGKNVARSMSPRIIRRDGSEVWGTVKVEPDFLYDYGIASYVRSRSDAYSSKRAGSRPLVIRAVGRGPIPPGSDVVISDADAETLITEDRKSGFLSDFRVIIVVD